MMLNVTLRLQYNKINQILNLNPPHNPVQSEIKSKFDLDPIKKFRGSIEQSGDVRVRNLEGDVLRGNIDKSGYGRVRDQNGNSYRVKPQ